jgi:hypothetical protein
MVTPEERLRERERIAIATTTRFARGHREVSWAGVWSGVLVAVASLVMLGALGVAVGISVLDALPTRMGVDPESTIAAGLWWLGSLVASLFIGGMVSTRVGLFVDRPAVWVHGTLVWTLIVVVGALSGAARFAATAPSFPVRVPAGDSPAVGEAAPALVSAINAGNVDQVLALLNDPRTADRIASSTGAPRDQIVSALEEIRARVQAERADTGHAMGEARDGLRRLVRPSPAPPGAFATLDLPEPAAMITSWIGFAVLLLTWFAAIAGGAAGARRRASEP